jgi:addiction module RelE/StbE family toxin
VNRALVWSKAFARAAKRLAKSQPVTVDTLQQTLEMLAENAFQPRLRTHKLKGKLKGLWSCYAGPDLRVLFTIEQRGQVEVVLLHTVGSHDAVY